MNLPFIPNGVLIGYVKMPLLLCAVNALVSRLRSWLRRGLHLADHLGLVVAVRRGEVEMSSEDRVLVVADQVVAVGLGVDGVGEEAGRGGAERLDQRLPLPRGGVAGG